MINTGVVDPPTSQPRRSHRLQIGPIHLTGEELKLIGWVYDAGSIWSILHTGYPNAEFWTLRD